MPEIKNNFIKGKMNKDLDERLIQKGEYREAQNIALSESADSDSGALETILGNVQKNITSDFKEADGTVMFSSGTAPETIGIAPDLKNKRIIYFITNFTGDASEANIRSMTRASGAGSTYSNGTAYNGSSTDDCCIAMYDIETSSTRVLAYGSWLNFSISSEVILCLAITSSTVSPLFSSIRATSNANRSDHLVCFKGNVSINPNIGAKK